MSASDDVRAYCGKRRKRRLVCWTSLLLAALLCCLVRPIESAVGPFCGKIRHSRFLECSGIASQTEFENALSSIETGSEHLTLINRLSIVGHPFVGHLTSRAFSFEHFHRSKNRPVNSTFVDLELLRLANGRIVDVEPDAFANFCGTLLSLDLSQNSLVQIPQLKCATAEIALVRLNLTGNSITKLNQRDLAIFPALQILDLSNNSLNSISSQSSSLRKPALRSIYLHQNYLTTLPESAFLPRSANLDRLTLNFNRFNCDCSLRWLVHFLGSRVNSTDEPLCQNPPSKRHFSPLKLMDESEFICEPLMAGRALSGNRGNLFVASEPNNNNDHHHHHNSAAKARPLSQHGGEEILVADGEKLVLECEVFSNPRSHVWWTFRDQATIGKTLEDGAGRPSRHTVIPRKSQDGFNVSSSLIIDPVINQDSGIYKCVSAILQFHQRPPSSQIDSAFLLTGQSTPPQSSSLNETFLIFQVKVQSRRQLRNAYNITLAALLSSVVLVLVSLTWLVIYFRARRSNKQFRRPETDGKYSLDYCSSPLLQNGGYLDTSAGLDIALGPPMYQGYSNTLTTYKASSRGEVLPEIDMSGYDEDYRFTDDIYRPDQPIDPRRQQPEPAEMIGLRGFFNQKMMSETEL